MHTEFYKDKKGQTLSAEDTIHRFARRRSEVYRAPKTTGKNFSWK